MNFQIVPELTEEMQAGIHGVLRAYNRTRNPAFFAAQELAENALRPLNIVVFNAQGAVIGGLIAETQFAWLKVSIMAVAEEQRRQGIGRRLLDLAEHEGLARGCRFAFVDTMDYQAPDFYRKLGYNVVGKLENWDSLGHTKYFFTKELTCPQARPES